MELTLTISCDASGKDAALTMLGDLPQGWNIQGIQLDGNPVDEDLDAWDS